jgi:two-component system KDP operon response regulator KdpE
VLVVDDDHGVLRLVELELSEQGFDVRTALTAKDALTAAYEQRPDLVILDVMLPDRSGLEVMRELRERVPVPIILLTARGADNDKVRGLELGADDYVAKPFNPAELTARARAVLRRIRAGDAAAPVVRAKDVEIDLDRRLVMRAGELVALTRTEWQLLQSLAEHPGKVLGSVELLTRVWGPEFRDDLQYLRVWISRLRSKLDPQRSEPELIQTFPGIGYMLNGEVVSESNAVDVEA